MDSPVVLSGENAIRREEARRANAVIFSSALSLSGDKTNRVSPKMAPERRLEIQSPDRACWQRQPEDVRRFGGADRIGNCRVLCAGGTGGTATHPAFGAAGAPDDKGSPKQKAGEASRRPL